MKNFFKQMLYITLLLVSIFTFCEVKPVFADELGTVPPENELYTVYSVYTNDVLFISELVQIGDEYISSDNVWYIVTSVDDTLKTAYAEFLAQFYLPDIDTTPHYNHSSSGTSNIIGLYHTHNAESFVPTDGTASIYGAGGIHDIGEALNSALESKNITTDYNQTLHIPHDGAAYTRSRATAQTLLLEDCEAVFDIHRDGIPRSSYVTTIGNETVSKIRIVIGKSNVNYEYNLEFALKIKTVADQLYPNLIKDIFMGKNRYNQDLTTNALLFECGTYLIEKNAVLKSIPMLADVINKTIYSDAISGDILISNNIDDLTGGDVLPPDETLITFSEATLNRMRVQSLMISFGLVALYVFTLKIVRHFKRANSKTSNKATRKNTDRKKMS